ncbi:phospholipase A2 inhibitor subunit gamma B-like [Crotalus adamanteus]|uniref:Phospholipase A2 inhibitor subunit gamma B-like n=1 Tax=Crotalus adamanteus TaxID=8729 RepID=A0AAW1AXJ7_CROAD
MQLLLGLCFFSVLLTTGSSVQCSHCISVYVPCSGAKEECPAGADVCMNFSLQHKENKQIHANFETCAPKKYCKKVEDLIGKPSPEIMAAIPGFPGDVTIKEVICSKASPSFALFFPAFLGLLLMKLLF